MCVVLLKCLLNDIEDRISSLADWNVKGAVKELSSISGADFPVVESQPSTSYSTRVKEQPALQANGGSVFKRIRLRNSYQSEEATDTFLAN